MVYLLKWKAVTFGLGGDLTVARSHQDPLQITPITSAARSPNVSHVAPEFSFNFGDGDGWSYLSGGIGPATWSVVPTASPAGARHRAPPDDQLRRRRARWFIKRHLAFSLDVRFYAINPSTPAGTAKRSADDAPEHRRRVSVK
jgi:hypothetical protein